MFAKFKKCEFWLREISFLGHIISDRGVSVDPAKVEAVLNWEAPKSVMKIRSFLGFCWILSEVYRRIFSYYSSLNKVDQER